MKRKSVLLAIFSSILLLFAFPHFDWESFAWIAFIPLFTSIRDCNVKQSFFAGCISGFVFYIGLIYWVIVALNHYGHIPLAISCLILTFLAAYLSLYFGLFTFFLKFMEDTLRVNTLYLAPFIWVSLEFARSHVFTGFPWELVGYSQYKNLYVIQIADITGVYGVSFLIMLINCVIFDLLSNFDRKMSSIFKKDRLFVLGILLIVLVYGLFKVDGENHKDAHKKHIAIGLIQPNIEQDVKWDEVYRAHTMDILKRLSQESAESGLDLVVWPETATPFYFQSDPLYSPIIKALAQETGASFVLGSPAYRRIKEGEVSFYNSAFLISCDGRIHGRYDKVHLVPFGEYVPLKKILPFVSKLTEGAGDLTPGSSIHNLTVRGYQFGILICYESIFPDLVRKFTKGGAHFLVNITNDSWYGKTAAPYQHVSMATLRAVENRVYIGRAANTGISAIIDPTGRIQKETEIFTRGYLNGTIIPRNEWSFYKCYGDIFAYGTTFFFLLSLLYTIKFRRF